MDSGDHSRGNVRLSSRDCPKVRSAGASVLPSQHRSGDNSAALRGGSISPFPAEAFPKERARQLMGKEEKEVRENKQPSRNPLHTDGWFVLQGDEEPLHVCGVSSWEIPPLQVNLEGRKKKEIEGFGLLAQQGLGLRFTHLTSPPLGAQRAEGDACQLCGRADHSPGT